MLRGLLTPFTCLRRFYNGGIVFSTIVLCFIAMISLYSFLLLVETRLAVHGSFGGPSPHCVDWSEFLLTFENP